MWIYFIFYLQFNFINYEDIIILIILIDKFNDYDHFIIVFILFFLFISILIEKKFFNFSSINIQTSLLHKNLTDAQNFTLTNISNNQYYYNNYVQPFIPYLNT